MNPFLKFKQSADDQNPNSLSANLRAKRFEVFVNNLNPAGKKILDVGGTHVIWENSVSKIMFPCLILPLERNHPSTYTL